MAAASHRHVRARVTTWLVVLLVLGVVAPGASAEPRPDPATPVGVPADVAPPTRDVAWRVLSGGEPVVGTTWTLVDAEGVSHPVADDAVELVTAAEDGGRPAAGDGGADDAPPGLVDVDPAAGALRVDGLPVGTWRLGVVGVPDGLAGPADPVELVVEDGDDVQWLEDVVIDATEPGAGSQDPPAPAVPTPTPPPSHDPSDAPPDGASERVSPDVVEPRATSRVGGATSEPVGPPEQATGDSPGVQRAAVAAIDSRAATAQEVGVAVVDATVVDDGHGTLTATYVLEVTSTSQSDVEYALTKELSFGQGVAVVSTGATGQVDGRVDEDLVNRDWDGSGETGLTNGAQTLPAGSSALVSVVVVVRLDGPVSNRAADCRLVGRETGTGLTSTVQLTSGSTTVTDQACLEVSRPRVRVTKEVASGPTRQSNGAVTIGYDVTVANTGDTSTVYHLDDEFRFAADAYVVDVEATNVVPGGIETNPNFDGIHVRDLASAPLRAGASHRYSVVVTIIDSQTATVAATRGGSLDGVGGAALGDDSNLAASLFKSLGEGAAGQVGGAAAGWAMGAMGISTGDSAALAQINADLQAIIGELDEIADELADIDQAIKQLDCDITADDVSDVVGDVLGYVTTYQGYVQDGAGTDTSPPVVPIDKMTTLATEVVDPENGLWNLLEKLVAILLPSGGQGLITSCLSPAVTPIPTSGAWGDNDYYARVQQITDYYYTVQVNGLLVLQESLHFLAQQTYASLPNAPLLDPDDTQKVCEYDDADIIASCNLAITYTNVTYENLAAQLEIAGASYDAGSTLSIQYDGSTARLVTKSLEALTTAAGDTCTTPLTASDPCGVTVGNVNTAGTSNTMAVTYGGYTGWRPADWNEFNFLIGFGITEPPYEALANRGIGDPDDKIIVSNTTYQWWPDAFNEARTATKFVDTRFANGVFNDTDDTNWLYEETNQCPGNGPTTYYTPASNTALTEQSNGWYDFDFRQCGLEAAQWNVDPGWFAANPTRASAQQFRWPMISVPSLSCTNGRSRTNPGGAWTRCGTDFDTWFDRQVPRPPTCAPSSTWGQCGAPSNGVADVLGGAPLPVTSIAYDCVVQGREGGTGLLNVATASDSQGEASDDACAETPVPPRSRRAPRSSAPVALPVAAPPPVLPRTGLPMNGLAVLATALLATGALLERAGRRDR